MKDENAESWDDFEIIIDQIERLRQKMLEVSSACYVPEILYRGQADSNWRLETTLERTVSSSVSLNEYYEVINNVKPEIETFTDKEWRIPSLKQYLDWLASRQYPPFHFDAYHYFVYLRHHGFPSPLLDWSASPYVAALFAVNAPAREVRNVSVYAFLESTGKGKSSTSSEPAIHSLGPNVRSHRRHFLQQSQYTICTIKRSDSLFFAKHEDVVARNETDQDRLWKINISVNARLEFLQKLQKMNINSFSLFATEDSLLQTLYTKIFLLSNRFSLPS